MPSPGSLASGVFGKTGRIAATQASKVRGWYVGQPIHNRTTFGAVPKWSTVRQRYWRNQAHFHPERFDARNLERAKNGLAEQRLSSAGKIETMELHHIPPRRDGGLFDFVELWPEEHAAADRYRRIGEPK